MSSAASLSPSSSSEAEAPSGAGAAAAAAALLWERAWPLEEVRAGSQGWSLAADAGLLRFLQEFSQQTISRTHEIKKQLDRLVHETKSTDCRLHNVFNGFLMLSNTQFIENRVYDDEVEEPIPRTDVGDKPEQEKTREEKEADLIPQIQEAVNYGLQVLDSAFEQLDIKAGNSDSEEESNERVELILEPKDLYIDRPLPYLIGSQLFMEQDDVGLGDLSSEEGSVDSDHGSMVNSEGKEEEDFEEELENVSEEDQKQRTVLLSDEDDDLFGDSERGEEEDEGDLEENAKLKKKGPTSFSDELAARIKGDVLCKREEQLSDTKNKMVADKEEVSVPSDGDEDIFNPPKLTDADFSPFDSKEGLFSGGAGLFDDEESDLFAELPKEEDVIEREARVPINDEPSSKAVRKVPAGAISLFPGSNDVFSPSSFLREKEDKLTEPITDSVPKLHKSLGLFDDDDDFESNKKSSISAKSTADFFDVEEDLFKEKHDLTNVVNNVAKENKELIAGNKRQPSSAENIKPLSRTPSKGQKSLFFDEEDSEDLFSSNQSVIAKNSSLSSKVTTKTSLSLFEDEDEEDHWNITEEVKPTTECSQKGGPATSTCAVSHAIKKGLFEEEGDEDLFAITKDSQRKPQKAALLFEDDAVNGGLLFDFEPSHLLSGVQVTTVCEPQADLVEAPQKKLAEEKAGPLDEPGMLHGCGLGRTDVAEQQRNEEPLMEKDTRRKIKSVYSLFEDEEKNENVDVSKSTQKEIGKTPEKNVCSKSTGVFQDEELLFSKKMQKDNDPDFDLFASNKNGVSTPRIKSSSEGELFGDEDGDEDGGLFRALKAKPLVAEKKTIIKKGNTSFLKVDSKVLEGHQNLKREEEVSLEDPEANLDINSAVLLPSETSSVKPPPIYPKIPYHEPHGIQHTQKPSAAGSSEETGVSFDYPMQADTLQNANKGRIKVTGKRRPPTRNARRLAAQESNENEMNISEDPSLPPLKENSAPAAIVYPCNRELCKKENTEKAKPLLSTNSSETVGSPASKSTTAHSDADDLFASNGLLGLKSKAVETKSLVSQAPKDGALDGSKSGDHFQPGKTSKKTSPASFLEDEEDLFATSKTAVKRKDPKPTTQLGQDPPMQDIFEDDIFAIEATKQPIKAKAIEANLFDIDIFADLAEKPKERSAKKKMEAKSIFDEDTDDIFSSSSQSKTLTKKAQSFQTTSGTKSVFKASSTFEDPLNAFEGQ